MLKAGTISGLKLHSRAAVLNAVGACRVASVILQRHEIACEVAAVRL